MLRSLSRPSLLLLLVATATFWSIPLQAQTPPRPAGRGQGPAKPPVPKPAPPAPAPAAAKPVEPAPPPKPVAQDLRMKTVYTAAGQKTESVTYRKGQRERFEFGDVVVLKQPDLKRTVQIMRAANTYMIVADGAQIGPPMPAAAPGAPAQTPGVVTMTTTITDPGERKTVFGLQARRAKTVLDKQPAGAAACDTTKQHLETDGWYVDVLPGQSVQDVAPQQPLPTAASCVDEIRATINGDPKVLGFPISYSTTILGDDGTPNVVSMEITELEITSLDPALFEIPPGLNDAGNLQALTRAVSDADETKLAQELRAPSAPVQKTPGVLLVGVTEVANKTTQQVDTRALRGRLVSELADMKLNAAPLPAAQGDTFQLAGTQGYDYVLVAEITDLKVSKGGGLGGVLKAASKVAGAGGSGSDPTEAAITIRLVQPDGKARYTTTSKGKDGGGGLDLKSGMGIAKFAGGMYMNMVTGRLMMNALNKSMTGNLGGVGMLGNPVLMNMQTQGLGMRTGGLGIDATAGAASFLMQQSLASNALTSGVPGQGPMFDAALGDALKNAAKSVADNLRRAK